MSGLGTNVDPDGLLEFSVVYTDRALNHMSQAFRGVMTDLSTTLKEVYGASAVAIVPGSGTFGMEAVARQFATGKKCLVIRNGWFSFRWTQIFERADLPSSAVVLKARRTDDSDQPSFAPPPIQEVVRAIEQERPAVVFAPHVETASGIILPDSYVRAVAKAVHSVGGLLVLDSIASGALWVDMQAAGVDVLISAPQKGWSGPACCALVMLSSSARERVEAGASTSFACDLHEWLRIMRAYEEGGHAYYATMPTDALRQLRNRTEEARTFGFDRMRARQEELGTRVRSLLANRGMKSVAAEGFEAPGVVVSYTDDEGIRSGTKFAELGVQIAAGVPLRCDEAEDFSTFRIGLFGLDKLLDVDGTVETLDRALSRIV